MASLKDTVISGSLRVTDTTYTNDLILGKTYTARYVLAAPTSDGVPAFRALTNVDVGLSNVENTKLSTWAGTSNITTVGTISNGTWNGTTIAVNKGGTGNTSYTASRLLYTNTATKFATSSVVFDGTHVYPAENDTSELGSASYFWKKLYATQVVASTSIITNDGKVGINTDNEGGNIYLLSKSGTYRIEMDAYNDEVFRIFRQTRNTSTGALSGYKVLLSCDLSTGNITATTFTGNVTGNLTGTASNVARATFGDASNGEHNCNNIASNGLWYYTSNGPSGLGNYTADGALYSQAYSSNWVGQIAQDYRNGGLFVRSKNNNSWQSWRAIPNGIHYTMTDKNIVYDASTEKFTKVAGGESAWNSQAISTIGYKECRITFQAGQTNKYIMVGLNTDPSADANWASIDYCWYLTSNGSLEIRESNSNTISPGTGHTSYAAGDEFIIEYSNGYIRYYHNGALCRAVSRTIGGLLYFDSSFFSYGNIYNVQFTPIQSNVSYGTALPASAVEGQTFFQVSDPWYELPPGGTSGQVLTKASNNDRDVSWASPSQAGVSEIANMIYPVGSIYMSVNSTDPSTLFGGTWERLKDRFLLSAGDSYSAGNTGGEATHKLVEGELPSHTHTLSSHTHSLQSHTHSLQSHTHSGPSHTHTVTNGASNGFATFTTGSDTQGTGVGFQVSGTYRAGYSPKTSADGTGSTGGPSNNTSGGPSNNTSGGPSNNTSGSTGSNTAHNNMPPYLVVYMWKRTA